MKRRMTMCMLLFFSLFLGITTAFAQFGGGDGSAATPYEISTAAHLKTLSDNTAGGQNYTGVYFILTQNISLSDYQSGEGWSPIGGAIAAFAGNFNGKGHIVSNLKINRPAIATQGLFGQIGIGGRVDSLGVESASVTGGANTGGLAGMNFGNISNCHYKGTVTGTSNTGGLVGNNSFGNYTTTDAVITMCYSAATVTGSGIGVGGLVGYNMNGMITKCFNSGPVTNTDASTGGIVGMNGTGPIQNSYNTGNIKGSNNVGGISGNNSTPGCVTTYCYSTGKIEGTDNVGGIAGFHNVANLMYCAAINESITGTSNTNRIVGMYNGAPNTRNNNYALNTMLVNGAARNSTTAMSNDGLDKTNEQLLQQTTYSAPPLNWNFTYTWYMPDGSFPLLQGVSPATLFGGGKGTEETPYIIETAVHLKTLADKVAAGENFSGKYFIVVQDIALTDYQSGEGWTPIGSAIAAFAGNFNGKGHIVSNLKINRPAIATQGLFGQIGIGGRVDSLGVESASVTGGANTGGLAGMNFGNISNCHYKGTVTGTSNTGGLVGNNSFGNYTTTDAVITMCYSAATVTGSGIGVGGLVGYNMNGMITKCFNSGPVTNTDASTGGIVGMNGTGPIQNSYNTGNIKGSNNVGGISGNNSTPGCVTTYCYSTGKIEGTDNVGGIAGFHNVANLMYCAAINESITGTSNTNRIVGMYNGAPNTRNNNYALNTMLVNGAARNSTTAMSNDGLDKTNEQLLQQTTYSAPPLNWNFTYTWYMPDGSFPLLKGVSPEPEQQVCNVPQNLTITTPRIPDWYTANLKWEVPAGTDGEPSVPTALVDNGPIVTHPGEGYGGADASMATGDETIALVGFVGNKESNNSLVDDFTLSSITKIDSIHFYTIQAYSKHIDPTINVKELYIRIYDKAPNAGGKIIWGDMLTNRRGNVVFTNSYRVSDKNIASDKFPIMRVTAIINTSLNPGTYWIEVSATSVVPFGNGGRILFPPVTIDGQVNTGNALFGDNGLWFPYTETNTGGTCGLPFVIYGLGNGSRYNVYRNDVKLTGTPISQVNFSDLAPGAGDYVYEVTAVHENNCESDRISAQVHFDEDPCGVATVVTNFYNESFENGYPSCWKEECDGFEKHWEFVRGDQSEPATAKQGMFKAMFKAASGATTKLISKKLDIGGLENPELAFWYAQKMSGTNQDQLRVFYKNNPAGTWTLLGTYTNNTPAWDSVAIALPNPTATYWIAFEATGNDGYGVMLDEVSIRKSGELACAAPTDLNYTLHTPTHYNVAFTWTAPDGSVPNAAKLMDNGPIVTHPGSGYNGADVSAIQEGFSPGGAGDRVAGYSLCDDFVLTTPTFVDKFVFYAYDMGSSGITPNLATLRVAIYDKSPKEGGKIIWGDRVTDRLNNEETIFSNIYRTSIDNLEYPTRPLTRVVVNINHALPAGTYWVEVIGESKTAPRNNGCIYFPPVTILGEVNTGNALQCKLLDNTWADWVDPGTAGACGLPFEILGKQLPLTYKLFRNGNIVNDKIAQTSYTDLVPGPGTYNYKLVAAWDNGCVPDTLETTVVMSQNPCEIPVPVFPFAESFETDSEVMETRYTLPACWSQEPDEYERVWYILPGFVGEPGTAQSGAWKAYFEGGEGASNKLITPLLDIASLENPAIKFWHAQKRSGNGLDELRIYYRTTNTAEWVKIAEYTKEIPTWKEEVILLPEKSTAYQIAFEGTGYYGRGVHIDNIMIGEAPTYTITSTVGANGSITPSGTTTVTYGGNQTFIITPDAGYRVKEVLIDGINNEDAVNSGSYTFVNVTANHTISAEFEQSIFTITATADANGTIAPDGATTLTYGETQEYTITANEGYKIKSVLVDDVAEAAAVGASSYSYTFSNVTADHTISAEFEQITYTITATAGTNGSNSPAGTTTVSYGSNQAYTITANNDYLIKEVKVDGVVESAAVGKTTYNYTFNNVKANHTISATFEIANPELTGITVNNQSQTISSAMVYMAACGEQSVSMTLTAVGEVKVNGAAYTNGSPISLTGDKTVITITVTAGSNTATYTLTVAKALGSTTPLYIERWGATIAIVNNPANNGGYTFDQIRWYRDGSSAVVSTDAYVVGNISTHYADVHAVETGAWHHTCRTKASPAPVQIVVYPNPVLAAQTLNVNLPEGLNEVNIDVYDINGKLVKQHPRVTTTLTAPAGTGIYVLKIQLPDGSITTEKIVVK